MHDEARSSIRGANEGSRDEVGRSEYTPALTPGADSSTSGGRNIDVVGNVMSSVLVTGNGNQITIGAGPSDITSPTVGEATFNLLNSQIETLSAELSEEKAVQLKELREQFREGAMDQAYESVREIHHSPTWVTLSATVRASILRALATMTLSLKGKSGVAEAIEFANRAKSTKPSPDDFTLEIRIAVVADGYDAALEMLGEPTTLDTYNLHLALLLKTGRSQDAIDAFQHPPSGIAFDAETYRLFALALLAERDVVGAREQISRALVLRPRRQYIRFHAAIINYFNALSELAVPAHLVPFPRPMNVSMVRSDAASQELLREGCGGVRADCRVWYSLR